MWHWSFNYNHHHRDKNEYFEREFTTTLMSECNHEGLHFNILPNFSSGYRDSTVSDYLRIGSFFLNKKHSSKQHLHYTSHFSNLTSGETIQAKFTVNQQNSFKLEDQWNMKCTTTTNDLYQDIQLKGFCKADPPEIHLSYLNNPQNIILSTKEVPVPYWSLFDHAYTLAQTIKHFTLLEELSKPRNHCFFSKFDEHNLQINQASHHLEGYALRGDGIPTQYWWLNKKKEVCIVSTTFLTYVRIGGLK